MYIFNVSLNLKNTVIMIRFALENDGSMNAMDALLNGQKNGELTYEEIIGEVLNLWHAVCISYLHIPFDF